MSAYIPDFKHDIFVSYAHADDQPFGDPDGWVTTMVGKLKNLLGTKLGQKYSLMMDHELARNEGLTDQLVLAVQNSATLLVVLSPAYLASEWCRRERENFLGRLRGRFDAGSLFIVYREYVEREDEPEEFRDLLKYKFWIEDPMSKVPIPLGMPSFDPPNQQYFNELNRLSHELTSRLKALKKGDAQSTSEDTTQAAPVRDLDRPGANGRTVFLAEVTDDLDYDRSSVGTYLAQAGLRVIPQSLYPRDSTLR